MIADLIRASVLGVVAGLVLLAANPVRAQEGKTIVVEGERIKSDRKICKSSAPRTGTRLGARKICRTAFEWKVEEQRSQKLVEQQQLRQQAIDAYKANSENALANQGPP